MYTKSQIMQKGHYKTGEIAKMLKPNEEIKNIHITSKDCLVNYFSDYNMSEATMFHLKK